MTLRERYDAAAAEASTLRREAEALRGALGAVEARLTDYQRKDADVSVLLYCYCYRILVLGCRSTLKVVGVLACAVAQVLQVLACTWLVHAW